LETRRPGATNNAINGLIFARQLTSNICAIWNMNKLLVTGAAGFIGANFAHYWMREYPQDTVVALDALTYAGNPANLSGLDNQENFSFVEGNILDQPLIENLLRDNELDTIVHFAAESHVDRSISGLRCRLTDSTTFQQMKCTVRSDPMTLPSVKPPHTLQIHPTRPAKQPRTIW